jgi:hypothetical protein
VGTAQSGPIKARFPAPLMGPCKLSFKVTSAVGQVGPVGSQSIHIKLTQYTISQFTLPRLSFSFFLRFCTLFPNFSAILHTY